MGFTPFPAGDGRAWTMTFTTDSGVFNLTGVSNGSIALHTEDINNTPSAADLLSTNPLGKPGIYKIYPVVTLTTGPVAMDFQLLNVISEP